MPQDKRADKERMDMKIYTLAEALKKKITFYQYNQITWRCKGFKMLDEYQNCPLGCGMVQLCKIGMMFDFIYGYTRCSKCFVAIPLPKYIYKYLEKIKCKRTKLPEGQTVLV